MKNLYGPVIIIVILMSSCTKLKDNSFENNIIKGILNIEIIPHNPNSNDEISFVHSVCNYEILTKLEINNNSIVYQREYNSLMKRPCIQVYDTVLIGMLPTGDYLITYELIDISGKPFSTDAIARRDTTTFRVN